MGLEITSTEAARRFGDLLAEVRYGKIEAVITKNGEPVAELRPHAAEKSMCLQDFVEFWREGQSADGTFADDLELVKAADQPTKNPWQ
jgi:prevent-host-death family protein